MVELVALAVIGAYLLLGTTARLLRIKPAPNVTDPDDMLQDEVAWVFLWIPATMISGIVMVIAGESLAWAALAVILVLVVGGTIYAVLRYGVFGVPLAALFDRLPLGGPLEWIVFPIALPVSLLVLLRAL